MALIRTLLLVPVRDNQGEPFPPPAWRALEERLFGLSRGYSIEGVAAGVWESDGRTFRDRSRRYIVAIERWAQFCDWIDIVRWARVHLRQEALYIEVLGVADIVDEADS